MCLAGPAFSAEAEVEDYAVCIGEKSVVNDWVRACPAQEQVVIGLIVENLKTKGNYEKFKALLEQRRADIRDMKVNPYACRLPKELYDLDAAAQSRLAAKVERKRSAILAEHNLNASVLTERQACAAIDIALKRGTKAAAHLAEYGIE